MESQNWNGQLTAGTRANAAAVEKSAASVDRNEMPNMVIVNCRKVDQPSKESPMMLWAGYNIRLCSKYYVRINIVLAILEIPQYI